MGATTPSTGAFTTLSATGTSTLTTVDINGGAIDGTTVGSSSASTGAFTTLSASTSITGTLATAAQTNITSVGTLTALTVDDITINGSTISDGGYLTIDAAGAISLDADDEGEIRLYDGGTQYATLKTASNGLKIQSVISDGDISFAGNDGGSAITAMTIDMSAGGNVGIGVTPAHTFDVYKASGDARMNIKSGGSGDPTISLDSTSGRAATIIWTLAGIYKGKIGYEHTGNYMNFFTDGAGGESMRITSTGQVFIGDSSFSGTGAIFAAEVAASGAGCLIRVDSAANASETMLQFQDAASQGLGSITSNPSANTTAYNTSSDGRLKDITGEAKGLEIINALNPVAFTWKSSGVKAEGLIAQEVEKLVDHAVSKTKESEYLQMDYSKLVTPLIKAVQELSAEVEQLKQQAHEKCEN
mgnify:CR=1 FL=1